jgi:hypothetical protein
MILARLPFEPAALGVPCPLSLSTGFDARMNSAGFEVLKGFFNMCDDGPIP